MTSGKTAAQREAVRRAEQTVADTWIGQLLLAESEAEAVVGACTRARRRAAEKVGIARRTGDPDALAHAQKVLDRAEHARHRSLWELRRVDRQLALHLTDWAYWTQRRIRQRQADCEQAG